MVATRGICLENCCGPTAVAEVVLTPDGPEEAALYDQTESVPQAVGDCLGDALGAVGWPLPSTEQAVTFPIVGGSE